MAARARDRWHGSVFCVPSEFRNRPFTRAEALSSGITRGVLEGPQFRRIHDSVYCHVDHTPTFVDRLAAARLALPDSARTTGITRIQELHEILREEKWRRGVPKTTYVLPHLTDRCRSMPETELLAYVVACRLPAPQVNVEVAIARGVRVTPDLWFSALRAAVEYEGGHHQEDRAVQRRHRSVRRVPAARRVLRAPHQGATPHTADGRANDLRDAGRLRLRGPDAGVRSGVGRAVHAAG